MDNVKIRTLSQQIVELLNNVPLPIETKRLIVFEIYTKLSESANVAITQELAQTETEKGE